MSSKDKRYFWLAVLLLIAVVPLSIRCGKGERRQLTIQGSTTVLPLAQRAAEAFMRKHPEANISVRGGGSGVGISALIDGTVEIATSSREMKTKELESARGKGIDPVPHRIAMDGIAVIVHPSNPIEELSRGQLKAIYTGGMSRWSDVGGKSEVIVVLSRDTASGTFEVFSKLALDEERVREDALMQASNLAVASIAAQTPGAIGYVGLGYVSDQVKATTIDGVMPTEATVASGEYPLARALLMYTNGKPTGLAADFIAFILGPEGQRIVEEQGFVPVR